MVMRSLFEGDLFFWAIKTGVINYIGERRAGAPKEKCFEQNA
jgi:hypothetical protein